MWPAPTGFSSSRLNTLGTLGPSVERPGARHITALLSSPQHSSSLWPVE